MKELSVLERRRISGRKYYHSHKDKYREYRKEQRKKRRNLVKRLKQVPCVDCGLKYPYYIMDFDHVRGTKRFNISAASQMKVRYDGTKTYKHSGLSGGNVGIQGLLDEIAKCDVVCANCHRTRTHKRRLRQKRKDKSV